MLGRSPLGAGVHRRAAQFVTASLAVTGLGMFGGCLSRPIAPVEPNTTTTVVEKLRESGVDKIDLLLVVDNSASMADKQKILAVAVPDLLGPLVNPKCLDGAGVPTATQPAGPLDGCPAGSDREFPPVLDIHIGVITSSLGTYGAGGCDFMQGTDNDHGHLITRKDSTNPTGPQVATYQGSGFLAWDPNGQLTPKGEANFDNLTQSVHDIVVGAGQNGCGYESQNEAWYRFLVDPSPPQSFAAGLPVTPQGIDTTLLAQRKAFLRPDSLLAIINVTDETDTSIKGYSYYPIIADGKTLPEARSECSDPNKGPGDHCCDSCGDSNQPSGCATPDTVCKNTPNYTSATDNDFLHAFGLGSHKERFGIDFFYPIRRYVDALTSKTVTDGAGKTVPNPIFTKLDPAAKSNGVRDASLVFYAAITGVPWQLIARQKNGQPDLTQGFKSNSELSQQDSKGNTFWDDIAGDPDTYRKPSSPFMQESLKERSGIDPVTGLDLAKANPITGGERPIHQPAGDIEYACTFPVLAPIDCSTKGAQCDCVAQDGTHLDDPSKNPLCAPNPADIDPTTQQPRHTLQVAAKAYPGIRNLAIARGLGDQGIAASICAKTVDPADLQSPEYGYRPAVNAIVDRLKLAIGGQCLPTQVKPDASGSVSSCLVLEARDPGGQACSCNIAARKDVAPEHQAAVLEAQQLDTSTASDCFCEIPEASGAGLTSCLNDKVSSGADGWCYVDDTHGNPALVKDCPSSEKRLIRLVGAGKQALGSTLFISCERDN